MAVTHKAVAIGPARFLIFVSEPLIAWELKALMVRMRDVEELSWQVWAIWVAFYLPAAMRVLGREALRFPSSCERVGQCVFNNTVEVEAKAVVCFFRRPSVLMTELPEVPLVANVGE